MVYTCSHFYGRSFYFKNNCKSLFSQSFKNKSLREIVFERSIPINGKLNSKVLVLNQSYEPISICSIRKAFVLIYLGKAEPVINDERKSLHSVSKSYPWPSIIRVNKFIKLPYKKVILTRKNILRRDSFKCAYCGRADIPLTVDHVFPRARGGDESWENLITACTYCNNKKGDRTPEEANMKMLTQPFKPSHILFIKNVVGRLDERWKPYLYLS